jgi:formylglycine-generating enzyme required for sulfatase activity
LYGPWCSLRVGDAVQRLRWIPPGTFWMGSPEDEEGRSDAEGPRHLVTIEPGFWIFDTPCTQALWEAVMGENPSRFKGLDLPVERVSWDRSQAFLKALNSRIEGMQLSLPSEAQWEYSCRAGTDTPRYREDLDQIAWYGENSQDETHAVGQKSPNNWGLYDILGSVWEWCQDFWMNDYSEESRGEAIDSISAHRVIRGGSWDFPPHYVRAAYRFHYEPSNRHGVLGFRCAEFRPGQRTE